MQGPTAHHVHATSELVSLTGIGPEKGVAAANTDRVADIPISHLVSFFIKWLKDDIRWEVMSEKPVTLIRPISYARLYDEKHRLKQRNAQLGVNRGGPSTSPIPSTKSLGSNIKFTMLAEMKERHNKGLCYNCDERFEPGDVCKATRQFFCIKVGGVPQDDSSKETTDHIDETTSPAALQQSPDNPEISFHALIGTSASQTIIQWGEAVDAAFESLKKAMINTPVLVLPDFTKSFVVKCHASGVIMGAVLMQEAQYKWLAKLVGYDYDIVKRGGDNRVADALSQCTNEASFSLMTTNFTMGRRSHNRSSRSSKVHNTLSSDIKLIIRHLHDAPKAGHLVISRLNKRIRRTFYWSGMKKEIKANIAACDNCQRNKAETLA
ncbi:hypothetical protein HHK36_016731 [Tetracentron sinense]|uniref:Integrase zinc-binding domain-containing protein n=1 Tax=Tetracentron sinense TaxID=13715 RepID=A0A834Z3X8_TETSI|nr:hypothetical protein HHK36_016731 [Tetracentron sinense]